MINGGAGSPPAGQASPPSCGPGCIIAPAPAATPAVIYAPPPPAPVMAPPAAAPSPASGAQGGNKPPQLTIMMGPPQGGA